MSIKTINDFMEVFNGFNLLLIPFMVDTYQKVCDFIDSYIHVMYDLN